MPRKATTQKTARPSPGIIERDISGPIALVPPSQFPKGYSGPTSGVMAPGAIGKAAREAARKAWNGGA